MKKTEKAQTIHGDIDYDVVECSNCPNEFKLDETIPVGLDLKDKECDCGSSLCNKTYTEPKAKSYLCQSCCEKIFGYKRSHLIRNMVHNVRWNTFNALLLSGTIISMTLLLLAVFVANS